MDFCETAVIEDNTSRFKMGLNRLINNRMSAKTVGTARDAPS